MRVLQRTPTRGEWLAAGNLQTRARRQRREKERRPMLARTIWVCVLAAALVPVATGAGDGKPGNTCPPGFNLGAKNLAEYLQLPRTQAAIADGLATEEDIRQQSRL
jgi:hypothetical protein